jgi:methionyl-tRNA formyltransferase
MPFVILEGDRESGITLHGMVREFDAGELVRQERFPVDPRETSTSLYGKSVDAARRLLRATLPRILDGTAPRSPMDLRSATTTPPLLPLRDIDRGATVERFDRTVRAFAHPYPGARVPFGGRHAVIWAGEPGAGEGGIPIPLRDGVYRAMRLSLEGGAEMDAASFASLHADAADTLGRPVG